MLEAGKKLFSVLSRCRESILAYMSSAAPNAPDLVNMKLTELPDQRDLETLESPLLPFCVMLRLLLLLVTVGSESGARFRGLRLGFQTESEFGPFLAEVEAHAP